MYEYITSYNFSSPLSVIKAVILVAIVILILPWEIRYHDTMDGVRETWRSPIWVIERQPGEFWFRLPLLYRVQQAILEFLQFLISNPLFLILLREHIRLEPWFINFLKGWHLIQRLRSKMKRQMPRKSRR
jgi:hypothetical protein